MADDKKSSIFQKALAAADSWFDQQIQKGRNDIQAEVEDEADFFYRKSVAKDQSFFLGTQGYQEKPYRLTYDHLKQMSLKDSIISAIIQTRQNQVSNFSKLVDTPFERGFKIKLKDEKKLIEEIKEELKASGEFEPKKSVKDPAIAGAEPDEGEVDKILDDALQGKDTSEVPENPEEPVKKAEEGSQVQEVSAV